MHPILIKIGNLEIHTYGFFIAIGFLIAIYIASYLGKKENLKKELIFDLAFYVLIFSIIGARILYVVINYHYYIKHPIHILKIWEGGLVYFGGFIFGVIAGYIYLKKYRINFFKLSDIFLTVLPLGQAFGRIGCLSAGCCYGKPCHLPWAIVFKNPDSLAPLNVPLHPTEVYHALANFLLFIFLFYFIRHKRKFLGQISCLYAILYSIERFIIEFFRGDPRGSIGFLSTSQFLSIIVFFIGILGYIYLKNKNLKVGEE